MGKDQSFFAKVLKSKQKREAGPGIMNVMVIKPYRSPKGTIRLRKKMVKVKDLSEIDAIAANL